MNILMSSAECTPFAKMGGLADVVASLAAEWKNMKHNPIIILPKYADIDLHAWGFIPTHLVLNVPMGNWTEFGALWFGTLPDSDVPVFLIENQDYFDRHGIYGDPEEFRDNARRFIFFSRAVLEAAKALNFMPDIVHAHDYHTAFTMAFLKSQYRDDPHFANAAGVYNIHNLSYQGWFKPEQAMEYSSFGMKEFYPGSWFEMYNSVNAMKAGIMFADKIITVSPTYSKEIRMEYFGEGMQDILIKRGADLLGILNGVDYNLWNPEIDCHLFSKYTPDYLKGKEVNKYKLLESHGVYDQEDWDLPLFGMISRLTEQKGIDILMPVVEKLIDEGRIRFVILGSGDNKYTDFFKYLRWKYPGRALVHIGYNEGLSHRIFAAADYFLVPSRFEPCGLTQMYALKYGSIPIVHAIGGLSDTVSEYNEDNSSGNGFDFLNYDSEDLSFAIERALPYYNSAPHWERLRRNAMLSDFSAARSADEYIEAFKWALEKK